MGGKEQGRIVREDAVRSRRAMKRNERGRKIIRMG